MDMKALRFQDGKAKGNMQKIEENWSGSAFRSGYIKYLTKKYKRLQEEDF